MNKISKLLWGIVLIVIGVVIGTNSLGITHINIFFNGWWTLFIIIPCFIGLLDNDKEGKMGNVVGLIIGVALLLATRGMFSFEIVAKMIIPLVFVAIGLSMIFNETIKNKVTVKVKEGKKNGLESIVATFAGQKVNKDDEEFKGANLDSVFGGIVLDLKRANIDKEAVIKASSIFGGIEIIVPNDVNIKVKSTPIFGGVSNKITNRKENEKTLYIEAFCMFGGVEVK